MSDRNWASCSSDSDSVSDFEPETPVECSRFFTLDFCRKFDCRHGTPHPHAHTKKCVESYTFACVAGSSTAFQGMIYVCKNPTDGSICNSCKGLSRDENRALPDIRKYAEEMWEVLQGKTDSHLVWSANEIRKRMIPHKKAVMQMAKTIPEGREMFDLLFPMKKSVRNVKISDADANLLSADSKWAGSVATSAETATVETVETTAVETVETATMVVHSITHAGESRDEMRDTVNTHTDPLEDRLNDALQTVGELMKQNPEGWSLILTGMLPVCTQMRAFDSKRALIELIAVADAFLEQPAPPKQSQLVVNATDALNA